MKSWIRTKVSVIGMRIEHGAEIYCAHAQRLQVLQPGQHALYVSAVKVVGAIDPVGIEYRQFLSPAFEAPVHRTFAVLHAAESVGKYMIYYPSFQPFGGFERRVVYRQLPFFQPFAYSRPAVRAGAPGV